MSRHFTIATGATALFALAGRGLAFSSHSDGIIFGGPTPPTPTPAPTTKLALLHSHIQAATEPTITGPPKFSKAEDNDADGIEEEGETGVCKTANQLVNYCASAIPNINSAPEEEVAQCLCCNSDGRFQPSLFDDAAASCAGWIKTAVPESTGAYSAWSTLGNLCGGSNGVGSSVCLWSSTPATVATGSLTAAAESSKTTPGAILITSAAAVVVPNDCESLGSIGSYCQQETSGFDDLPFKSQAECLCYVSTESEHKTTWVPDTFDGAYSSCSGASAAISLNSGYNNICSRYGDFLTAGTASTTTTMATTAEDSSSSPSSAAASSTAGSTTASRTPVTVTVAPTAEPSSTSASAAAAGLGNLLPASWPVAIGAVLGAAILSL